ncbi:MAG: hypothetical protein ACPG4T_03880 [Nannocystaceae bacterium]
MAVGFFVCGVVMVGADRFLHDEGLLSWFFAEIMANKPIDSLFFLKSRPPLALFYAPVAKLGLDAFLWLHVLLAALCIPLAAAIARSLGQRAPNLVGAAFAVSPMMLATGASGVGNSDVVVGSLLVLYLLTTRRSPAAAGLMAGVLPFIRAEISIFVLGMAGVAIVEWLRSRGSSGLGDSGDSPGKHKVFAQPMRFLAMLPVFGLVLAVAGMVYHQEVLWFLHYPPTLIVPGEATAPHGKIGYADASPAQTLAALLSIAPLVGLLALIPWRRMVPVERLCLVTGLVFVVAIRGLPLVGLFHFDDSPRYALPMILMMIPLGRLANVWQANRDSGRWATVVMGALLVAGIGLQQSEAAPLLLLAVAGWSTVWAVGRLSRPRLALGLAAVLGLIAATSPHLIAATRLESEKHARFHEGFADWAGQNSDCVRDCRIITNVYLLAIWGQRDGLFTEDVAIEQLITRDVEEELGKLANHENGQYDTLLGQLRTHYFGRPLLAEELQPGRLTGEVVFVLQRDRRLAQVMPPEVWDPLLTTLVERDGLWIAAFAPPAP